LLQLQLVINCYHSKLQFETSANNKQIPVLLQAWHSKAIWGFKEVVLSAKTQFT